MRRLLQVSGLYTAHSDRAHVVSTHAVDAALAAFGKVEFDPIAAAGVALFGFSPGTGSLVRGVQAVPVGARVCITSDGVTVDSAGAAGFECLAHDVSYVTARAGLLATVDEALEQDHTLALTAGLDSRVVAAAARWLGRECSCVTWGEETTDALGAAVVARHLGYAHRIVPISIDWDDAHGRVATELRISEGIRPPLPPGLVDHSQLGTALLTGAGGESGRAFYSLWEIRARPRPSRRHLLDALISRPGVASLKRGVLEPLVGRLASALDDGRSAGFAGWAELDHFYASQRMPHWGRAMLPDLPGGATGAFLSAQCQSGLLSLPNEDKLTDGFHRRFLREHAPDLAVAASAYRRRRGVPAALRRVAARVRDAPHNVQATLISNDPATIPRILDLCPPSKLFSDVVDADAPTRVDHTRLTSEMVELLFGLSGALLLERELIDHELLG